MELFYGFGGFPVQQEDSVIAVSYWVVPNGCEYDKAYIQLAYFSDKTNADEFCKLYSDPPEMAFVITLEEIKRGKAIIAEREVYNKSVQPSREQLEYLSMLDSIEENYQ